MPAPTDDAPPSGKIRWLFLGISVALLIILLISSLLAVRYLDRLHAQEQAIAHALAERSQMLSSLSFAVQSYNESVQQFVAETEQDNQKAYRRRIDQLTLEIDSDLRRYPVDRDSAEAALIDGLRDLFIQQRTVYISVIERNPDERRQLIARRIKPLQQQIADWSSRLRSWNVERVKNADRSRIAEFAGIQNGLSRTLAIGFGSGLLLVLAGMAYIVRLERQTAVRYTQLAQLSARLLDAQEAERRSISRELHDEIGQLMGALLVDIGRLSTAHPELSKQLDSMKSLTERTFQSVRNISLLLRPSMLDDLGLVAALEWQGREISRSSDIEVDVQSENVSDTLPDDYKICVYRIVQEALTNAVRHSGARNAKVSVRQFSKSLRVEVKDDGHGFDAGHTRGLGLLGMEERVARLGGTLSVESAKDHGVTITAELPLKQDAA